SERVSFDTIKDGVVFGRVVRTDKGLAIVQCPKSSIILKTIEKADMASKDTLSDFIAIGEKNYPAEHYLMDLSTHGGGYKNIRTNYQYVLYDSESAQVMTLDELKDVLGKAPSKFDILGFDACLMAMAEVMYGFKDSLNPASGYFIGSPEATSAYGWPYGSILKSLAGEPSKTPEELAKEIVNLDAEYYKAKGITEELLCAIKLSKLEGIAKEFFDLSGELAKVSEDPAALIELKNIRASVLVYNDPSFVDLVDLCDLLAKSELKGNVKEKASGVIAAVKEAVIDKGFTEGRVTQSGGISIFFPADKGKSDSWKDLKGNPYSNLAFAKAVPQWQAFLENFNASLVPYLTNLQPDSGKAGVKVEARGFFGKEKGEVYIGGAEAPVVSWKADKLEIKVPNGAKSGQLQVKVKDKKSNGIKFEVF
ncbi:MAG: clostripain-related cysteine peptidase, partial [Firmicutes bacterium]|nr:clostripain-related cysteine peptidase [Bacillota bacterium]